MLISVAVDKRRHPRAQIPVPGELRDPRGMPVTSATSQWRQLPPSLSIEGPGSHKWAQIEADPDALSVPGCRAEGSGFEAGCWVGGVPAGQEWWQVSAEEKQINY